MRKSLSIILTLLIFLQSNQPARADFGLTASIVGLGVGVGLVVVPPFLDKADQNKEAEKFALKDESENEYKKAGVDEEEFFNSDLSRTAFEDLKLKVGRR